MKGKLGKQIVSHSVIYGIGDILRKSFGFALIPIYTHALSPSDYGVLELLDLVSYILGLLLAIGISEAVLRFYFEYEDPEKRNQVLTNAYVGLSAAALIGLSLVLPSSPFLSQLVFETPRYAYFINIVVLTLVIELFAELCLTYLRIQERSVLFTVVSLSKLALALSLNIYFLLFLKMGIAGILLSGLIAGAATMFLVMVVAWKDIQFNFSRELLWQMLIYSAPLMFNWFSMFILNFGDRFLLQRYTGFSDLGLYSLAYKFGMLPQFLVCVPFMRYWSVKRFELMKDTSAKHSYSSVFTFFCLAEIYVCLGIAILLPEVLPLISTPEYHRASEYVPLILLAYFFNGVYLQLAVGLLIKKKTRVIASYSLLTAIASLALNFLLIPELGAWGAALTTLLSFMALSALVFIGSQKVFPIKYEWGRVITILVVATIIYYGASLVSLTPLGLRISLKFLLAASFPLVLWVFPFYKAGEREMVRAGVTTVIRRIKGS